MSTIWDFIHSNPSERPKYTRYELAKLVKQKRVKDGLSIDEASSKYNVEESFWSGIENATRVFNVKVYNIIGSFLNMTKEELLSKETDDLTFVSYRTNDESLAEIKEAVDIANVIFNEMVMQEKMGSSNTR
ncbi:helix-turn-helix domain-containing protein [Rossellomorea aquimaris]|uniref:Helix-turn-helix transcriptional regulator n=1 Tax=Rossellomorea aquimaris TaxID=189382 RepID=A0A5D4TQ94_9BACI|nr:helix-turn-helix transcriptional regulator [Rossellomorea aquimaris]TYS76582.1 helix-turn-helix transcriptional regulator [Rossellomorea aquimaris]